MNYFWWHMHDQLIRFHELTSMNISTTGPAMCYRGEDDPSDADLLLATTQVFSAFHNLTELYFSKIILTKQLQYYFGALVTPLKCINLYAAKLDREDLVYMAHSHHIGSIVRMELAYNEFHDMCNELCHMLLQARQLEVLSLKMSMLEYHEKVAVMLVLTEQGVIKTLCMYENENMLSANGYNDIVELACDVKSLTEFYLWPYNYKPFELFFRPVVTESCQLIAKKRGRGDLKLLY